MTACAFCRIAAGETPAEIIEQDDRMVAFRDLDPKAPLHVLVVPKRHIPSLAQLDEDGLAGHLILTAAGIARSHGYADSGFRVVVNTGTDGGMTVPHLHVHVLAGRAMGWPPG